MTAAPLLRWQGLGVAYADGAQAPAVQVVRDLSFELHAGECLAIVGESGSGKTQSMLAPFGLAPGPRLSGQAWFDGVDLVAADEPARNALRGRRVGFVFQDPLTSLAPHLRIGEQLTEGLCFHRGLGQAAADQIALQLLQRVQLTEPGRRLRQYPHELSGGMRQRVVIAMALACEPALLVADEPTTALDATVQAEVLSLLHRLQRELGMAMVFISHDLGAVARVADQVLVMKAGAAVEQGPAQRVLAAPQQAYTRELAQAARPVPPRLSGPDDAAAGLVPVVRCDDLTVAFAAPGRWWLSGQGASTTAVQNVSLSLAPGEALGIVGESGSGKSTLMRALVGLQAFSGEVAWRGQALRHSRPMALAQRLDVQMVFQDALASLDPSLSVGQSVALAVRQRNKAWPAAQVAARVASLLQQCGLDPALAARHPTQLSGGQNQRAAIARALGAEPSVLACDEAVSALDVTVRNQLLDLLDQLRRDTGLAILFVTHDMAVVRRLCDRVVVLYRGQVVERGSAQQVLLKPTHAYTQALLAAVPELPAEEVF
jgi:peptide/nickel transport system ATP-binding protein